MTLTFSPLLSSCIIKLLFSQAKIKLALPLTNMTPPPKRGSSFKSKQEKQSKDYFFNYFYPVFALYLQYPHRKCSMGPVCSSVELYDYDKEVIHLLDSSSFVLLISTDWPSTAGIASERLLGKKCVEIEKKEVAQFSVFSHVIFIRTDSQPHLQPAVMFHDT